MKKIIVIHNIASSYYNNILYNEVYKKYKSFKVIHLAETENIRKWKLNLHEINYPTKILKRGRIDDYNSLTYITPTYRHINKENPDIIYIVGFYHLSFWVALFWAVIKKRKIIIEMDSNEYDQKFNFIKFNLKKIFIKRCNAGVCYGNSSKSYLEKLGMNSKDITIKPNISDGDFFFNDLNTKKIKFKKTNNFIYVGRLSEEKNLRMLINTFLKTCKESGIKDWGLIIVGDGPLMTKCKELSNSYIDSTVEFHGFVHKEELAIYYHSCQVFVLPSFKETWGLVVNEAMACGLPVIVSDMCGCSDDLVKNNGFTFNPYEQNELELIFTKYMTNQVDLELQSQVSLNIIRKYTPDYAAQCLLSAVKDIS